MHPVPGATFQLRLEVPLPRAVVWERLWDAARHTRFIPLTTVEPAEGHIARTGHRFTAHTGVGPVGVDDVMIVREAATPRQAPWLCRVEKVGRMVHGSITATALEPRAGTTELVWRQSLRIVGLPRALDPVVAAVARRAYAVTIRRIIGA